MNAAGEGAVVLAHESVHAARSELREIALRDFRNLAAVDAELPPDGVVVVGDNGHGKTNLLEAIRYLTILRSARGVRDADVVRHSQPAFHIAARVRLDGIHQMSVGFERSTKRKKVVVDGGVVGRLSDAFGFFAATLLSPSDVSLIAGSPSERRRYMDVLLSLLDSRYLISLQRYRSALLHRNAALRLSARGNVDEAQIAVWEPALAQAGAVLWNARADWSKRAAPLLQEICVQIGERGEVGLEHVTHGVAGDLGEQQLLGALESRRRGDIRHGSTTAGPHRDDLRITHAGRELGSFGSGGQQRTAALALRLLEAFEIRDHQGRWPLLLLDDPFAELDAHRSANILGLVGKVGRAQVVMTVPRDIDVPTALTGLARWRMCDGRLMEA